MREEKAHNKLKHSAKKKGSDTRSQCWRLRDTVSPAVHLYSDLCVRVLNWLLPSGTTGTLPSYPCLCLSLMESPCSAPSPCFHVELALPCGASAPQSSMVCLISSWIFTLPFCYPSCAPMTSSSAAIRRIRSVCVRRRIHDLSGCPGCAYACSH